MPVPSAADTDDVALPGWAKLLVVLAVGVAVSGALDFGLSRAGYGNLATLVWAAGYAGTLIVVWLVWGQDLELVGDTGVGHDPDPGERSHTDRAGGADGHPDADATADRPAPSADGGSPPESY